MKNNDTLSYNLNKIIATLSGLIAIYFLCVWIGAEWAVSLLIVINIIPVEEVNGAFVILPAGIATWCFSNAEKFKKKGE